MRRFSRDTSGKSYGPTIGHNLRWPPSSYPPPEPKCFSPLRTCTCDFPLTLTKSRLKRIKICRVIIGREACRGRERSHGSAESLVCVIIRFVCSDSLLVYWWKTKSKQPFHRGTWQLFFFPLQRIFCWKPKVFKTVNSCAASCRRRKLDQSSAERQKLPLLETAEHMHASRKRKTISNVCVAPPQEIRLISQTNQNSIFVEFPSSWFWKSK